MAQVDGRYPGGQRTYRQLQHGRRVLRVVPGGPGQQRVGSGPPGIKQYRAERDPPQRVGTVGGQPGEPAQPGAEHRGRVGQHAPAQQDRGVGGQPAVLAQLDGALGTDRRTTERYGHQLGDVGRARVPQRRPAVHEADQPELVLVQSAYEPLAPGADRARAVRIRTLVDQSNPHPASPP